MDLQQQIFEISKRILAESDINSLLTVALDEIIEMTVAERGLIILFEKDGNFIFQVSRNLKKEDIEKPKFEISQTIINGVRQSGEPIYLENALNNQKLKSQSIIRLRILSVICLPLQKDKEIFGVIYLDSRSLKGVFTQKSFQFCVGLSALISYAAYSALDQHRLHKRISTLEKEIRGQFHLELIVGHHPKMVEILRLIGQVSHTNASVLIQGESGTGKEIVARSLHYNSPRNDKAFIPINCGALPENLLESELFGHVKGSFTGAVNDKKGWFKRAQNGTIFLDEICEMTPASQVKLIRVLQSGEYSQVGGTEILHSDVRVIAATNQNLNLLVKGGKFREDLYYRLNVINIKLPPLRDRRTDIPLLIQHFLKIYNSKSHNGEKHISKAAEKILLHYHYPGNIRELENAIQHAVIFAEEDLIKSKHLPEVIRESYNNSFSTKKVTLTDIKRDAAAKAEQEYIIYCLERTRGHISKAAEKAGINVSNFHRIMKKFSIDPSVYKNPNN